MVKMKDYFQDAYQEADSVSVSSFEVYIFSL